MDKNIAFETFNQLDLFDDDSNEPESPIVVHIPHSSTYIPSFEGFIVGSDIINNEIDLLTDHKTDEIFLIKNANHIIAPFNRIFCDVERLDDNKEVMFKYGRGFYYTHTDSGIKIRTDIIKNDVYNNYYLKHHQRFNDAVNSSLKKFGKVLIIDGHSFTNKPFKTDLIKKDNRPDFCIGTDNYHTPTSLIKNVKEYLESSGYTVSINDPYSGTIVPLEHYRINDNVHSIMIEINRDLYIGDHESYNALKLNNVINELINVTNIY